MISRRKKYLVLILLSLSLAISFGLIYSCQSDELLAEKPAIAQGLAIPIDCSLGKDCFVMLYVDRDPGPKAIDFGCGRQTYDGHKGTDFAISDLQQMAKGVPVTAATAGTVLRVRDGAPDKLVQTQAEQEAVRNRECGNGIIVEHDDGWETQYCHLRQGSIAVTPGTKVKKGTVLGMVGASGLASFPHVHLTVRYQGQVVDPFVGVNQASGCQVDRLPLWEQTLEYLPTGLIRAGFAPKVPQQAELWRGLFSDTSLPQNIPALVFWVHAYGVLQGDVEKFKLSAPDGEVVLENTNTLEKSFRSWVSYAGKRNNPQDPLPTGVWQAEYQLMRGDRPVFELKRELQVSN